MSKLKPCPFCGSEVVLQKKPLWQSYDGITHGYVGCYEYDISCDNQRCRCQISLPGNNTIYNSDEEAKQNAIKAWNRRAKKR